MRYQLLFSLPLALALAAGVAEGQLPERQAPSIPSDPGVPPPVPGGADPRIEPQPVVQPGTIQRSPVLRPTRELVYLQPGEPPAGVQLTAAEPRSITLSWSAPAGASGYWIHQAGAGQTTYYRGSSLVTETTATVNHLLPATTYSFKVSAVYPQEMQRREGVSAAVNAVTAAAPAPTGLTASVPGGGQVRLSWNKTPEADGFRVSRNGTVIGNIKRIPVAPELATSFDDSAPVGTHLYQVQAVYVVDATEAVSALAPTPPVSVTIEAGTRVKYCQTRAGPARCAEPGSSPSTLASNTVIFTGGRKSP